MNWGYKILLVYITFITGIMILVFKASGEKDDLVTTDYYAKELRYQQRIDEMNRANALSGEVHCELKEGRLNIGFPEDFSGKEISGNILLYCPSDEKKDIVQDFSVQDSVISMVLPNDRKGSFELQLKWKVGGLDYYFAKKIFI